MEHVSRLETRLGGLLGAMLVLLSVLGTPPQAVMAEGGQVAYIASDFHSIHVVEADGSGDRVLLSAPGSIGDLAWSTDGKLLAYTLRAGNAVFAAQRLFVFDASSGQTREVRSSQGTYGPIAFFPDGKRLAAVSNKSDGLHCGGPVLAVDVTTGAATTLVSAGCFMTRLQVTPDGANVIATSHGGDPSSTVMDVSLSGAQAATVAGPSPSGGSIAWSGSLDPSGVSVAYIAIPLDSLSGKGELTLVNRDGSHPHAIWSGVEDQQLRNVAFSPDGTQLAAALLTDMSFRTSDEDIWLLGVDGSNPHMVASGHNPTWRPGGALATGQAPANSAAVGAQGPATDRAQGGARVLEAHSPSCLPRCFTFLYVVQGDTVWQPLPGKLAPAELAKLQRGPDLRETLSVSRSEPAQLFILDDGTDVVKLYLVQGDTAWLVVPQQITDQQMGDLGKLKTGGTLEGPLPPELLGLAGSAVESPPATSPASTAPETLTDSVRADILAAVDRANAAWAAASGSLDASSLDGNVAGQELSDDLAQIDKLRNQGHTETNVNTSFTVVAVELDAAGHATVHTRETWSSETHAADSGQLLQRTPPTTYQETYIVEYQDTGWIVTKNDVS